MRVTLLLSLMLSTVLSGFLLSGCAAMQEDYQNQMCNYDAAFESGANAARQNGQMQGSMIAGNCPIEARDSVMSGYRAGYASVPQQRPVLQPVTPVIIVRPPVAGGLLNPTYPGRRPSPVPDQQCVESYGRRVCGYGCQSAYGLVRCASNPRHSCISSYGKIECGLNCRGEFGRIFCDEWD